MVILAKSGLPRSSTRGQAGGVSRRDSAELSADSVVRPKTQEPTRLNRDNALAVEPSKVWTAQIDIDLYHPPEPCVMRDLQVENERLVFVEFS